MCMTCFASSPTHAPRRQSTTLEVVHHHEKLALESGVEFRLMAPISAAGFWSMCQEPNKWKRYYAHDCDR